jgi:hypothetical protein
MTRAKLGHVQPTRECRLWRYIFAENTPSGGIELSKRGKPSSREATAVARAPRLTRLQRPRRTDVVLRWPGRASICGQTWHEFVLLHARDFFSTALPIRSSSSFPPQICSNHEAAAAHEQMVDLTTASSTSEFYRYQSCYSVPC